MKKIFVFGSLFISSVLCFGQENSYWKTFSPAQTDSLKQLLTDATNDTLRLEITRQLGIHYEEIDRDSSLKYHEGRILLARKLNQKFWEADALDATGWVTAELKNYPKSLAYFLEAMKLLEDESIEKNIWNIEVFSPGKDPEYARLTSLAMVKNDFSQLYNGTGEVQKELKYLFEGLRIAEAINNQGMIGLIHANIAQTYNTTGKADSALVHGKAAFRYMEASNYTRYIGYALLAIGNSYVLKNDFELAEKYLQAALEADKKYSIAKLPESNLALARLYQKVNNPAKALYFAHQALDHTRKTKDLKLQTEAFSFLYTLYESQHKNDSAFHYLTLSKKLSDSLNQTEKDKIYDYLNLGFNEQVKQQELEQARIQQANKFRLYAVLCALGVVVFIAVILLRNNRNRKKANKLLQQQKERLEITLSELKAAQSQLIQSEKMASLGELTAGIAHEIQNPLNFVNNFSEVSTELIGEMNAELAQGELEEAKVIANDLKQNLEKIIHHGKRADAIVKGMLQHSRTSAHQKELTDLNALADEYLRLAYHALRAKDKSFNASVETNLDTNLPKISIVPSDIGRVILNLLNNAFYAVNEKQKSGVVDYRPTVTVYTKVLLDKADSHRVEISVSDNGNGIPEKIKDKIFQPFFTTKPTGQGTGLGLSLSYDIIKAHGGELLVESKPGVGTEFIIQLPIVHA